MAVCHAALHVRVGGAWGRRWLRRGVTTTTTNAASPTTKGGGDSRASSDAAADDTERPLLPPRVLVIAGPTAVGKTSLSLRMAKALGGEIVSADSVQVYRGLDVGSSKLPENEREGIVHYLLDILHPSQEFGAGDFCERAVEAIDLIVSKGERGGRRLLPHQSYCKTSSSLICCKRKRFTINQRFEPCTRHHAHVHQSRRL